MELTPNKNDLIQNIQYGKQNEKIFFKLLNSKYKNVIHHHYDYNYYDFYNDDYIFELKSRYYYIDDFKLKSNDVYCNKSKIDSYINDVNLNKKFIFIAKFLDAVYQIEYSKKLFDNYVIKSVWDDAKKKFVDCYCILLKDMVLF
jgi:hypothetical protein